jgi:arylsulfatase A
MTLGMIDAQEKPNIVFILADDLGHSDISYNNPDPAKFRYTPNLDSICREGLYLENFYTHHVCSPSRAGLLTGRHYTRVGSGNEVGGTLDNSIPNVAKDLKSQGYVTGAFGKWHNSYMNFPEEGNGVMVSKPDECDTANYIFENFKQIDWGEGVNAYGFDHWMGYYGGGGDYFTKYSNWHKDINWWVDRNYAAETAEGYVTNQIGEAALSFIETYQGQPFFCYVPMEAVHEPLQITLTDLKELCAFFPGTWDQVKDIISPLTGKKISEVEEIRTEAGAEFDNDVIDPGKTFFQPLVYATILYSMDKVVGDILVKLEEHSLSENTIIFFCSDNGANADGLNAPFRGFKKSMWEGGIHVPAAIWWPGRVDAHLASYAGNGGIYSGFAQYLDFYPTMMSLADLPIAGTGLDGIDLKNVLINNLEARGGYDDPYYGVDIKKGGLRSDRWKLHYNEIPGNSTVELYDLESDIAESNNVASANSQVLDTLVAAYRKWVNDNNWGFSYLPISPENLHSTDPDPRGEVLEVEAWQKSPISNGDNYGVFIRFARPNTTEFVNNVESGDRIEFDIYVDEDSETDQGVFFTPGRGWNPYYTSSNGVTHDSLLLSGVSWPKGKWIRKVVGIGNNGALGIPVCYIALRSPAAGYNHFYVDNVVLRKNDGTIRSVIWQDHTDTRPLIYRYRNTNYNNLSAALNVSGFPFSDIRLGIAQADEIEEYEIEVLRNLQDTTLKDSLLFPLDGLFGIVGGDGTESISLSIPQLSREDLLTAEIIESGSTLRLRRVSEETGTVAVFLKAEYKNAIMYQLFEVSVLHPTLVHPPQASMMQLYPNPVGHLLTLQGRDLPYYSSVSIHDITGKIIQIIPVKNVKYMIRIDTSEYHHGIYLLTLSGSDKLENRTLKFIVGKS